MEPSTSRHQTEPRPVGGGRQAKACPGANDRARTSLTAGICSYACLLLVRKAGQTQLSGEPTGFRAGPWPEANSPGDMAAYRATSHAKCSSSGAISFSQARRTAAGDPGVEMITFPP